MTFGQKNFAPGIVSVALIIAASLVCYSNSFRVPFLLDDYGSIQDNPSIVSLSPLWKTFCAPAGKANAARPILNFSFAANYALSRDRVWSYHAANLLFHVLSALTLYAIVRRTLLSGKTAAVFGAPATGPALFCALVFLLHPLQTEAVTYIIQRTESLAGLFFLLALYFSMRGFFSQRSRPWHLAATAAFLAGIGTKETIATAPLCIFLYDIVFVRRNALDSLRRSRLLYAGLGLAWVLELALVASGFSDAGTFPASMVPSRLVYLSTQAGVILHYLRLFFIPRPLCFDYAWPSARPGETWPAGLFLIFLLFASMLGIARRRPEGFLGAWFFLTLAPSSSLAPLPDAAVEYRMYLALIAPAVLVIAGGYALLLRFFSNGEHVLAAAKKTGACLLSLWVVLLGAVTYARNMDYRTEEAIWADTVKKRPANFRAKANLAQALLGSGRYIEAEALLREVLQNRPDLDEAHYNLANLLAAQGKTEEAMTEYRRAIALRPGLAEAYVNLAVLTAGKGDVSGAVSLYRRALSLKPRLAAAHFNLANALAAAGLWEEAAIHYREVTRLDPGLAAGHFNLGVALSRMGKTAEAGRSFTRAKRLEPVSKP
jgi:tetratricopeptide (TPR) repeat protein